MKSKIQIFVIISLTAFLIDACKIHQNTKEPTSALIPGDAEVKAAQSKYPGVTIEQLSDGYSIYSGPCTQCHPKRDLYSRSDEDWTKALSRMTVKAKLNEEEKDHLTKYIFAMRASHPGKKK